jgi:hypothetical protein
VMHELYSKGLTVAKIRVQLCDDFCEGNDKHPELPSHIQVVFIVAFYPSIISCQAELTGVCFFLVDI